MIGTGSVFGATDLDIGNNFDLHYKLAHHYLERADFDLAEAELKQAIIRKPDSRKAHRDYMVTSLTHLNIPQAIAEFMIVVGLGKAVPLSTEEQKQLDRDTAKLHYRKALKYEEQNRAYREIYEFRWANYYLPNNPTIMRSLAFALANVGNNDDAEKLYRDSFAISAEDKGSIDDAYAHADFAYMLGKIGRQGFAIEEMKKAVAIDPKSPALRADLAWFLEAMGDIPGATYQIAKAIDLAPNYAIGNVQVPTSSHDFFGLKMLTFHKEQTIYSNAGLWAKLGTLLEKQKKFSQAITAYEKALQFDPQQADIKIKLNKLKNKN